MDLKSPCFNLIVNVEIIQVQIIITFSFLETNKKFEALLDGMKNELTEMRKEIKSLKENNTICKGTGRISAMH